MNVGRVLLGAACLLPLACSNSPSVVSPATDPGAPCGSSATIDDGEDQNNQVVVREGRSGYWYTYADEGSEVTPREGETFVMSEGGARGSAFAARVHGKAGTRSPTFVGMGLNLVDPKAAYDASDYGGVRFLAKQTGPDPVSVRVKIPDVNTDPDGGRCKECFNDFGVVFVPASSWTEYVVPFGDMQQDETWGDQFPRPTPTAIYQLQWQPEAPGKEFDLWVDDVAFVGCAPAAARNSADPLH